MKPNQVRLDLVASTAARYFGHEWAKMSEGKRDYWRTLTARILEAEKTAR